jgi:hypothetical protein
MSGPRLAARSVGIIIFKGKIVLDVIFGVRDSIYQLASTCSEWYINKDILT